MSSSPRYHTIRLILGDQLNAKHSWFRRKDDGILYLMMEVRQETDYVVHHIQKVLAFFHAMRSFAEALTAAGHHIRYLKLDDPDNQQDLTRNIDQIARATKARRLEYQLPDEYRLDLQLRNACLPTGEPYVSCDSEHFYTERTTLADHFSGKKTYLLESFYRMLRRKHGVLMAGDEPEGSKWNFDQENRSRYDGKVSVPTELQLKHDVTDLYATVVQAGVRTMGRVDPKALPWPKNRKESLRLLHWFCEQLLPFFGTYQDAMKSREPFMFHSRLSFSLNTKMLSPREVVDAAVAAYRDRPDLISLPQVEGFVRQILGWREYVRGVYWANMPGYAERNFFSHVRELPGWYWNGETGMNCLHQTIRGSLDNAYAHHIQRLMITGNFALLAGVDPRAVDDWYLGIYIDAIEWVEITNTRGMSQFADGGLVGTKPYVSSGNYIDKMSDYCSGCDYDRKSRHGDKACPFNSLYWHFHQINRPLLEKNPRIGMVYRTWDKMSATERDKTLRQAEYYMENLDML
ncbi:MAG: cryptochrome/photolyase family protein [Bacteroidota bacterium]